MSQSKNLILSIETSGDWCSAAFCSDGETFASALIDTPRMQSSRLAPMIDQLLKDNSLTIKEFAAVAVSSGPGSYTGLRVGVSLAKGLCFGAGIPLIGVGTLDLIANQAIELNDGEKPDYIVPMIDARRMEVYQAIYDNTARRIGEIEPLILEGSSYTQLLAKGKVLFCGDGCAKFEQVANHPNARFLPCCPDARYMAKIAHQKYLAGDFEDVAYMEPFYLKDFRIGQSKKNILGL